MSDADEILIGEGVALESGAAPVTFRMLSGVIDVLISVVLLIFVSMWLGVATQTWSNAWSASVAILATATILVFVPAIVETLTRGRSVGRLAAGLRVVRDDGGPVTFRHAFTRALVGVFETYLTGGVLAVTVSLLSARGKRIGDYLAGTYAMRTRGAKSQLAPLAMPPHLAEWAASADIRRLPDGLALTARLFLSRVATLRPDSRARLGTRLAEEISQYVAPQAPAGTHPEYYIMAVLTTRRDREYDLERKRLARADSEAARVDSLPYNIPDYAN